MFFRPSEIMVVHGNYAETPALAIADCRSRTGIAVNVPDGAAAGKMADFFLAHGIAEVDRVLVSSPRSGNIRGLKTLCRRIHVRQLVMPELDRYSSGFRKKIRELHDVSVGLPVTERTGNVQITSGKDRWRVEYRNPASGKDCCVVFDAEQETLSVNGRVVPFFRSSETVEQLFLL
jgi:hypothetical protein